MNRFLCRHAFFSLGYIPISGIDGLYCNCIIVTLGTARLFYSSYAIFHSYHQCMRILIFPYPGQHLLSVIFNSSNISGCEVISHYDFDFISLLTDQVEHCISSLEKCLLRCFAH